MLPLFTYYFIVNSVFYFMNTMFTGAVGTAEELAIRFHTMTNNPDATICTFWSKSMDGTLEAVEHMSHPIHLYLK